MRTLVICVAAFALSICGCSPNDQAYVAYDAGVAEKHMPAFPKVSRVPADLEEKVLANYDAYLFRSIRAFRQNYRVQVWVSLPDMRMRFLAERQKGVVLKEGFPQEAPGPLREQFLWGSAKLDTDLASRIRAIQAVSPSFTPVAGQFPYGSVYGPDITGIPLAVYVRVKGVPKGWAIPLSFTVDGMEGSYKTNYRRLDSFANAVLNAVQAHLASGAATELLARDQAKATVLRVVAGLPRPLP